MKATYSSAAFIVSSLFAVLFLTTAALAQVGISSDGGQPNSAAILDLNSTTKGLLIPRMAQEQIQTITNPANGLLVFCTDDNTFYAYIAGSNVWKEVLYGTGSLTPECGTPITDSRDNKTYNTVKMGTQCWMAQNINIGNLIQASQEQTNNGIIEKYCFNDDLSYCGIYGGLYQWQEMMNYTAPSNSNPSGRQGICPDGWHIPSQNEWCQMETYLDATFYCGMLGYTGTDAGGKLKEPGTIHWASPNEGATNLSGFTGLPAGGRYPDGTIKDFTYYTYFWTATDLSVSTFLYHVLSSNSSMAGQYHNNSTFGFSVRCVKD